MNEVSQETLELADKVIPQIDGRTGDESLAGPVLGEFVQTEDEVGAEVLAQEVTIH